MDLEGGGRMVAKKEDRGYGRKASLALNMIQQRIFSTFDALPSCLITRPEDAFFASLNNWPGNQQKVAAIGEK